MIDNYLLQELVTFSQTKTLAKTAEQLNVTQPTVTRGMQKLEADFGVQLFSRQPNRITLTPTGDLAATEAAKLLHASQQLVTTVRNFDQTQHRLKIGMTIPGPLLLVAQVTLPPQSTVTDQLLSDDEILDQLRQHDFSLIFSNHSIKTDQVSSRFIGTEALSVHLNKFMYQANQASVSFSELKDLSFIVMADIGPWRSLIQQAIPNARFFYQKQRDAFTEITQYSDFPYFSTTLSIFDADYRAQHAQDDSRVEIPISDSQASMPIYACYLTADRHQVMPLIDQFVAVMPEN